LAQGNADTTTLAGIALPHSTLLPAFSIALWTDNVACQGQLGRLALIKILQKYIYPVDEVLALAWPLTSRAATATKESTTTE